MFGNSSRPRVHVRLNLKSHPGPGGLLPLPRQRFPRPSLHEQWNSSLLQSNLNRPLLEPAHTDTLLGNPPDLYSLTSNTEFTNSSPNYQFISRNHSPNFNNQSFNGHHLPFSSNSSSVDRTSKSPLLSPTDSVSSIKSISSVRSVKLSQNAQCSPVSVSMFPRLESDTKPDLNSPGSYRSVIPGLEQHEEEIDNKDFKFNSHRHSNDFNDKWSNDRLDSIPFLSESKESLKVNDSTCSSNSSVHSNSALIDNYSKSTTSLTDGFVVDAKKQGSLLPNTESHLKLKKEDTDKGDKDKISEVTSVLEQALDMLDTGDAVVGLDHIIEYKSKMSSPVSFSFRCILCNSAISRTLIVNHVMSEKHRLRYMKLIDERRHFQLLTLNVPKSLKEFAVGQAALEMQRQFGRGKVAIKLTEKDPYMDIKLEAESTHFKSDALLSLSDIPLISDTLPPENESPKSTVVSSKNNLEGQQKISSARESNLQPEKSKTYSPISQTSSQVPSSEYNDGTLCPTFTSSNQSHSFVTDITMSKSPQVKTSSDFGMKRSASFDLPANEKEKKFMKTNAEAERDSDVYAHFFPSEGNRSTSKHHSSFIDAHTDFEMKRSASFDLPANEKEKKFMKTNAEAERDSDVYIKHFFPSEGSRSPSKHHSSYIDEDFRINRSVSTDLLANEKEKKFMKTNAEAERDSDVYMTHFFTSEGSRSPSKNPLSFVGHKHSNRSGEIVNDSNSTSKTDTNLDNLASVMQLKALQSTPPSLLQDAQTSTEDLSDKDVNIESVDLENLLKSSITTEDEADVVLKTITVLMELFIKYKLQHVAESKVELFIKSLHAGQTEDIQKFLGFPDTPKAGSTNSDPKEDLVEKMVTQNNVMKPQMKCFMEREIAENSILPDQEQSRINSIRAYEGPKSIIATEKGSNSSIPNSNIPITNNDVLDTVQPEMPAEHTQCNIATSTAPTSQAKNDVMSLQPITNIFPLDSDYRVSSSVSSAVMTSAKDSLQPPPFFMQPGSTEQSSSNGKKSSNQGSYSAMSGDSSQANWNRAFQPSRPYDGMTYYPMAQSQMASNVQQYMGMNQQGYSYPQQGYGYPQQMYSNMAQGAMINRHIPHLPSVPLSPVSNPPLPPSATQPPLPPPERQPPLPSNSSGSFLSIPQPPPLPPPPPPPPPELQMK